VRQSGREEIGRALRCTGSGDSGACSGEDLVEESGEGAFGSTDVLASQNCWL